MNTTALLPTRSARTPRVDARDLIPDLLWTVRTSVSPFAADAEAHVAAWVRDFGLVTSDHATKRFLATRVGEFAARVYPSADSADLCLAADWIAWLDCLDDQNDDNPAGLDPDVFDQALAEIDKAGRGAGNPATMGALGAALADLMARSTARTDAVVARRLTHHVSDYLMGNSWQAAYKWLAQVPDSDYYPQMRRQAGGMFAAFDLIEITERAPLPSTLYHSPTYQRMLLAAADVVCWCNDLLTVEKEDATGDVLNYVLVLERAGAAGRDVVLQRVSRMIGDRVADFLAAEAGLHRLGEQLHLPEARRADLVRCAQGLRAWMRGHVDWGLVTARYVATAAGQRPDHLEDLLALPAGNR